MRGIYSYTLNENKESGVSVRTVFVDYRVAYNTPEFQALIKLNFRQTCGGDTFGNWALDHQYAIDNYADESRSKWMIMILGTSEKKKYETTVLASIVLYDREEGVELDAVCGIAKNEYTSVYDTLLGDVSYGSLILCTSIQWILEVIRPLTPIIFLKANKNTITRYGSNGFVPSLVHHRSVKLWDSWKFQKDTFYKTSLEKKIEQDKFVRAQWPDSLYMFMENSKAKYIMRYRCKNISGQLKEVPTNLIPNYLPRDNDPVPSTQCHTLDATHKAFTVQFDLALMTGDIRIGGLAAKRLQNRRKRKTDNTERTYEVLE
jgi:hypothetical protein